MRFGKIGEVETDVSCACGCGEKIQERIYRWCDGHIRKRRSRYIRGHSHKGRPVANVKEVWRELHERGEVEDAQEIYKLVLEFKEEEGLTWRQVADRLGWKAIQQVTGIAKHKWMLPRTAEHIRRTIEGRPRLATAHESERAAKADEAAREIEQLYMR